MKIEFFDVCSLSKYSFSVNKTNRIFTLLTVLLTLTILALSILINYQTVSHLWISRSQLPIRLTRSMSLPISFTDSLICWNSNDSSLNGTVPNAIFNEYSTNTQLNFPSVTKEWVQKNKPSFIDQLGSNFGCVNIAGYGFPQFLPVIEIGIFAQKSSIFIEVINENEIIQNEGPKLKKIDIQATFTSDIEAAIFFSISASIKDSLKMSYNPEQITMLYHEEYNIPMSLSSNFPENNYAKFAIVYYTPIQNLWGQSNFNHTALSITRLDLGFIIGAVLSWISIFTLVFGFIAYLYMDRLGRIQQILSLFYIKPQIRGPSIVKFIIASFKKGIFPKEDHYVRLYQKIQNLKDIGLALKMKHAIGRMFPFLKKDSRKSEVFGCNSYFSNQSAVDESGCSQISPLTFNFGKNEDQKPNSLISSTRKFLLQYLDFGLDQISINYKKAFSSKCNVIISIILFIAFILILSKLGSFQVSQNTQIYNSKVYQYQYDLQYNQIILAADRPSGFYVQLVNGHNKIIDNIKLTNSSSCFENLSYDQLTQIKGYASNLYCFQKGITLARSFDKDKVVSLYINNTFYQDAVYLFHYPKHSSNFYYSPLYHMLKIASYIQFDFRNYQSSIKLTNFIGEDQQNSISSEFSIIQSKPKTPNIMWGVIIVLDPVQTTVSTTKSTIFDVVQNIWGFATIFFALTLSKIGRHINILLKDRNEDKQIIQNRENISVFLSKINALQTGRHMTQLTKAKYYFKFQMPPKH